MTPVAIKYKKSINAFRIVFRVLFKDLYKLGKSKRVSCLSIITNSDILI